MLVVVILVGLFSVQRIGTGGVGRVFGWVMLLWFTTLATLIRCDQAGRAEGPGNDYMLIKSPRTALTTMISRPEFLRAINAEFGKADWQTGVASNAATDRAAKGPQPVGDHAHLELPIPLPPDRDVGHARHGHEPGRTIHRKVELSLEVIDPTEASRGSLRIEGQPRRASAPPRGGRGRCAHPCDAKRSRHS